VLFITASYPIKKNVDRFLTFMKRIYGTNLVLLAFNYKDDPFLHFRMILNRAMEKY